MKKNRKYTEEEKIEVINYVKEHNVGVASKKFGIPYNTINFWVNPKYKEYTLKQHAAYYKDQKNYEIIKENTKKYCLERRKTDPEYVAARNEAAKRWQKEKRKKDPEWRNRCVKTSLDYYEAHKHEEGMKAYFRQSVRKRRDRKIVLGETYTREDEAFTKNLFDNKCVICGATKKLEIDHWRPLSKGFALSKQNAVLLCKTCNRSKWHNMPEEHFSEEVYNRIQTILESIK